MMTKRKKRPRGLEGRRARAGVLFILPWLIGFFGMFVRSLVTSLVYSVSKTTIADFGMNTEYIGFDYYYRALFIDSNFVRSLIEEVGGMLLSAVHTEKGEEVLNLIMVDDKIPAGAKLC